MVKPAETKRTVGYSCLEIKHACGTCYWCRRTSSGHLRCDKHGFSVQALGICRTSYEPMSKYPLLEMMGGVR